MSWPGVEKGQGLWLSFVVSPGELLISLDLDEDSHFVYLFNRFLMYKWGRYKFRLQISDSVTIKGVRSVQAST